MCYKGGWNEFCSLLFLASGPFWCCLHFWLLRLVSLAPLFCSWLSIENSWDSRAQRVPLWILRIHYYYDLLFYPLFPLQIYSHVFLFSRVLCFCILFSLSRFLWFCQGFLLELFLPVVWFINSSWPCCFLYNFYQCCYYLFNVFGCF